MGGIKNKGGGSDPSPNCVILKRSLSPYHIDCYLHGLMFFIIIFLDAAKEVSLTIKCVTDFLLLHSMFPMLLTLTD